ncbi:MAG TPA: hypothetical protein GXX72_03175 [Clostridiaceae bacterium]|nr:hypothetical protein [Clostridiaceae bacterium]
MSFWDVVEPVAILLIIIAVGFILQRLKLLTRAGAREMTMLLMKVILPCVIINSFQIPYKPQIANNMLIAFFSAVAAMTLSAFVSFFVFSTTEPDDKKISLVYATLFSNAGFFSLPVLESIAGAEGVVYGSMFLLVFNIFTWTVGIWLMEYKRNRDLSLLAQVKRLIINPGIVGIVVALILFFTRWSLPGVLGLTVKGISALNTPLAMIVVGFQIGDNIDHAFKIDAKVVLSGLLRNVVLPLLTLIWIVLLIEDEILAVAALVPAAAPTAANAVIFAYAYERDIPTATQCMVFSTLLSLLTLPALIWLARQLG